MLPAVACTFLTIFQLKNTAAQTQLTFNQTPVVSGTAGALNTTYTYSNVGTTGSTTIRAVIKIVEKTGGASLYTIDATSGGSSNAWQPVINGPSTANGSCWGIKFEVSFYDASNGFPLTLASFSASGVDIDGDGGNLREYNEPYGMSSYTVENPTDLTVMGVTGGYHFRSPQTGYNGISLTQTNVAATWLYEGVQTFSIKIGSCCVGGSCSASGSSNRQSSINFYDAVSYNVGTTVLPVDFLSFNGHKTASGNKMFWNVSRQSNVVQYVVEKSESPAGPFVSAGIVPSSNSNSETIAYTYLDSPNEPVTYYRVKAVDKDGHFRYSSTIKINQNLLQGKFQLINSGRNRKIQFDLESDISERIIVNVTDHAGKLMHKKSLRSSIGKRRYELDNFTLPGTGMYLIQLTTERGQRHTGKLVVY